MSNKTKTSFDQTQRWVPDDLECGKSKPLADAGSGFRASSGGYRKNTSATKGTVGWRGIVTRDLGPQSRERLNKLERIGIDTSGFHDLQMGGADLGIDEVATIYTPERSYSVLPGRAAELLRFGRKIDRLRSKADKIKKEIKTIEEKAKADSQQQVGTSQATAEAPPPPAPLLAKLELLKAQEEQQWSRIFHKRKGDYITAARFISKTLHWLSFVDLGTAKVVRSSRLGRRTTRRAGLVAMDQLRKDVARKQYALTSLDRFTFRPKDPEKCTTCGNGVCGHNNPFVGRCKINICMICLAAEGERRAQHRDEGAARTHVTKIIDQRRHPTPAAEKASRAKAKRALAEKTHTDLLAAVRKKHQTIPKASQTTFGGVEATQPA